MAVFVSRLQFNLWRKKLWSSLTNADHLVAILMYYNHNSDDGKHHYHKKFNKNIHIKEHVCIVRTANIL